MFIFIITWCLLIFKTDFTSCLKLGCDYQLMCTFNMVVLPAPRSQWCKLRHWGKAAFRGTSPSLPPPAPRVHSPPNALVATEEGRGKSSSSPTSTPSPHSYLLSAWQRWVKGAWGRIYRRRCPSGHWSRPEGGDGKQGRHSSKWKDGAKSDLTGMG